MNVNDLVQERIDTARRKAEQRKRQRQELDERRKAGLAARHRAKLARREDEHDPDGLPPAA